MHTFLEEKRNRENDLKQTGLWQAKQKILEKGDCSPPLEAEAGSVGCPVPVGAAA